MKVLQVVPELSAGGVERTTLEIASALVAAGHEAHVASAGGRLEEDLAAIGGVLHRLPVNSKNVLTVWQNSNRLARVVEQNNIDIIHARSRAPALSSARAAKLTDTPYVTTYHGIYNASSKLKRWYNAGMTRCDHIIANSEFTKAHILSEHGTVPGKITVIPRGVDMARFDPAKIDPAKVKALRAAWGLEKGQLCYLLPGRLTRWKGQAVAIKALASKTRINPKLVLLGDAQGRDDYVDELRSLASEMGHDDNVVFAGHYNDMPTAFTASDVVLSTSTDPEAFGRVAAEAQAMGKWVIASDHGGSRETVVEGVTGTRVIPGNPDALMGALEAFAANGPPQAFSPSGSRAHITANFSTRAMQDATLRVYDNLLKNTA